MSPNTLTPSQPYTLSYFITDPNDNATYYVRAVVYDAITGEVLDTKNLTALSTNPHLFTVRTQAPGDSSGHGRRIVVVATAYEDSGYTTKSAIYQEQSENYIVIKPGAGLALGGGGVDWPLVQEMIQTEVGKATTAFQALRKPLETLAEAVGKIPTETYNLLPIIEGINELKLAVARIPLDNSIDLSGIVTRLDTAIQAIADKEVTEKTDIQPLQDAIEDLKEEMNLNHGESITTLGQHMNDLHTVLPSVIKENAKSAMGKSKFKVVMQGEDVEEPEEEVKKPERPPVDIKSLM